MTFGQMMLPEFDHEMASTRKTLERLPAGKFDFTPHPKSGTMAWTAAHIIQMLHWGVMTCTTSSVDLADPANQERPVQPKTAADAVAAFDKGVAALRPALEAVTDAQMSETWELKQGDKVFLSMPRAGVLRTVVFNHIIHHRAQLALYLRLNDVPVPALYGPSADES